MDECASANDTRNRPSRSRARSSTVRTVKLPYGAARVVLLIVVTSAILAGLARPPLPDAARTFVILVLAGVAALSARSSLLLLAARRGLLVVDAAAPRHRLLFASAPAALASAALALPLTLAPAEHARFAVLCAGVLGALVGAALATRDRRPKGPRPTSTSAWLVLDTALPAGVVAGLVGVTFGFLRLHALDVVQPGELARHLAGTTFAYALFVGLGGFYKAYGEQSAGLVVVTKLERAVPGPVLVGGVLGIALLIVVARAVPPLALKDALVVKAAVGFVAGATLSLLGALQGARAASLGIKREPR